jgi:hypothetical protein
MASSGHTAPDDRYVASYSPLAEEAYKEASTVGCMDFAGSGLFAVEGRPGNA